MPRPFVVGNWKMNTTIQEAGALASAVKDAVSDVSDIEVVLCPPFVSLAEVARAVKGSSLKVGAQDMHFEDKGAFTGEISAAMLKDLCQYIIIGHSERRRDFGETNEMVNKKMHKAREAGLRPIVCVGESLEERQQGREASVIASSVTTCVQGARSGTGLTIAYEPVWAIGTGLAATGDQAQAMASLIKYVIAEQINPRASKSVTVLYGGSVTPDNVGEFVMQADIDGALVGGASLDAGQFADIVRITVATCKEKQKLLQPRSQSPPFVPFG